MAQGVGTYGSDGPSREQALDLWRAGVAFEVPSGFHVRIVRRLYPTMAASELSAREREVSSLPDHPDHAVLRSQRRRIDAGHEVHVSDLWLMGPGRWRRSESMPGDTPILSDVVVSPESMWLMTPGALNLLEPGVSPPPGKDLASLEDDVRRTLRLVLVGNLGLGAAGGASPGDTSQVGSALRMSVRSDSGLQTEYTISGSAEGVGPVVAEYARVGGPRVAADHVDRYRYLEWRRIDGLPLPVASRIERLDGLDRVSEVWTIDVRPITDREFRVVAQPPAADGHDPLRGAVTVRSVFDYRSRSRTVTTITEAGSVSVPMSADMLGHQPPLGLRTIGWIGAGVLVALLLGIRIARVRARRVAGTGLRH